MNYIPTSRTDVNVMCPFYKYDWPQKRRIVCEGITDTSSLALQFPNSKEFNQQQKVFCCGKYEYCEVYRMLAQKYEEDEQ